MAEEKTPSGMIVTVGGQSEQILYSLQQGQPEYVAFLATATEPSRNETARLCRDYGLAADHYLVLETADDPREVGRLADNCLAAYHWLLARGVAPECVSVDATGGRKWMSAAAILVGVHLGLALPYVHADYPGGKLDPSTMRLVPLGDVYEFVSLPELRAGTARFKACDYAGAAAVFREIRAPDPVMRVLREALVGLAELCDALDRFEQFREGSDLPERFAQVERDLRAAARRVDYLRPLEAVAQRVGELREIFGHSWEQTPSRELAAWLYLSARRREQRGQYDGAILLYYRILELAAQVWLWEWEDKHFDTSAPDWSLLPPEVVEAFHRDYCGPQDKVGLVNGYVLLYLLGDEHVKEVLHPQGKKRLAPDFEGKLSVRNLMVAEHGFLPFSAREARVLRPYAEKMAQALLGMTIEEMEAKYGLPDLPDVTASG